MPTLSPIPILKSGSTHFHIRERFSDLEDWIAVGLPAGGATASVHDARSDMALPAHDTLAGVVITGSHAMVSEREPWSEALLPWLRTAVLSELPALGICYGHQLLAHALGGRVAHHPDGVEIGTRAAPGDCRRRSTARRAARDLRRAGGALAIGAAAAS